MESWSMIRLLECDVNFLPIGNVKSVKQAAEDSLLAAFGSEYLQYRKKVCRYLGRKHGYISGNQSEKTIVVERR